ncbi:MAG: hypothetical protein ACJASQ_002610 [Crocinitomicaceae bacterium]|jgi:hypothetical protein
MRIKLPDVLSAPSIPNNLDRNVKWLAGEGGGSWFLIEYIEAAYRVSRYSPIGNLECSSSFSSTLTIDLAENYSITYPSHCALVTVIQNEEPITLNAILTTAE